MALVTHRDPQAVAAALARWTAGRAGVDHVRVVGAEHPSIGYSSETVLVDLAWSARGHDGEQTHQFVVRLAPPTVGTFRDYDLAPQTTAQMAAAAAGVATASPELVSDPEWLGVPFIVMPRIAGHIIGEVAAFDPWLASLSAGARAHVHEAFVGAVAATHRADVAAARGVPERDNGAELDFWAEYLDWSSGGAPVAALVDGLVWCREHRPDVESEPVLLWGDVRFGNVIFGDDLVPRAVLDWDMTSIGAREHDVAWFTAIESLMGTLLGRHLESRQLRHPNVEEGDVEGLLRKHLARFRAVAALRRDDDVRVSDEQLRQRPSRERLVVGDENAHRLTIHQLAGFRRRRRPAER